MLSEWKVIVSCLVIIRVPKVIGVGFYRDFSVSRQLTPTAKFMDTA